MEVVRDLVGGTKPSPVQLHYNGDLAADSTTKRYKGSLVKLMDFDDKDHGRFYTFAGLTTAMENFAGILEEEVSAGFLPDDAAYSPPVKKVTPCFPSTIIRGEYAHADAAGTSNLEDNATGSAASTTLTIAMSTTDYLIGGWVYFVTGSNAGYLHYVTDSASAGTATLATALNYAVTTSDTMVIVNPSNAHLFDFDATYTGIKSEVSDASKTDQAHGIMTYISAPGLPFQRLVRETHDGLKIDNAKFYHDFTISVKNAWTTGVTTS